MRRSISYPAVPCLPSSSGISLHEAGPAEMGAAGLTQFRSSLTVAGKVAASTQDQARRPPSRHPEARAETDR